MPPTRDQAAIAPATSTTFGPLLIAGAISLLGGIAIIWLFAPMFFAALGPGELALIAGLIALPLPTAWVLWKDARNRRFVAIHPATPETAAPGATPADLAAHARADAIHEPATRTPTAAPRPATTPRPATPARTAPRRVLHEPAWSVDTRK